MSSHIIENTTQLRAMPLFQGMESDLLEGLLSSARYVNVPKGDIFLEEDQPVTRFYIVMEGWCGAMKNSAGGQLSILQIFRAGDFLPEPGNAGTQSNSHLNLQALAPTRLAQLTPNLVRNALEQSTTFAANMLKASKQRCDDLRNHIEQLTLYSAEQRVGRFLLDMRLASEKVSTDITLPFDKSLIASYLGIKPETLSRTLQHFRDSGFVIDRNHLKMPFARALCDFCDSSSAQHCANSESPDCPQHGDKRHAGR